MFAFFPHACVGFIPCAACVRPLARSSQLAALFGGRRESAAERRGAPRSVANAPREKNRATLILSSTSSR